MSIGVWNLNKKTLILDGFESEFIRYFKGSQIIFSDVIHLRECKWKSSRKGKKLSPVVSKTHQEIYGRSNMYRIKGDFPLETFN